VRALMLMMAVLLAGVTGAENIKNDGNWWRTRTCGRSLKAANQCAPRALRYRKVVRPVVESIYGQSHDILIIRCPSFVPVTLSGTLESSTREHGRSGLGLAA
jgi:hypothetical protein